MMKPQVFLYVAVFLFGAQAHANQIEKITLPPGFEIHVYAEQVPDARSLALSPNGTLFVGTRRAGNVYAIVDRNQDHIADEVITVARGLP